LEGRIGDQVLSSVRGEIRADPSARRGMWEGGGVGSLD
jgi:hypothetical protein